jgi:phospholipid N-methyltransferase
MTNHTIPEEVLEVLRNCSCDGKSVVLHTPNMPRPLYVAVNKVLEMLGGKWDKKTKSHIFQDETEQLISLAIMTGLVADYKKEFQIFETPDAVADLVVEKANINPAHRVLEPSAGRGQILKAINRAMAAYKNKPQIYTCEMHEPNVKHLKETFADCAGFLRNDFLTLPLEGYLFDRIVMNPPFRNGQDIAHVRKAFLHLADGGRLVSVTYPGWQYRTDKKYSDFREWLSEEKHEVEEIPAGSFSASGTSIKTLLLTIDRS